MAKTIADFKAKMKMIADSNIYYGKWWSATGNGRYAGADGHMIYVNWPNIVSIDCGLVITLAIYLCMNWNFAGQPKGYIWPNNGGAFDWFLVNVMGARKMAFSKSALQDGDIIIGSSHCWVYYGNGQIFEANDGYSSVKAKQVDIHNYIGYSDAQYIFRLPWEKGTQAQPVYEGSDFELAQIWSVRKGSQNCEGLTRTIQGILNAKNNANLLVDGDFGALTEAAVIAWQKKYPEACGAADGIVGQMTWFDLITRNVG